MDISNLWHYNLRKGSTNHPRNGACLFDAGMWLVYGKIGDNPPCSCPIIRSYGIGLNDTIDDTSRQLLKPFILRVVGNLDPKSEAKRLHFIVLETIRRIVPLLLDAYSPVEAYKLRSLKDNATYAEITAAASTAAAAAYTAAARTAAAAAYTAVAASRAAARAVDAAAARAAAHAVNAAAYTAANTPNAAIWQQALWILDGALRIGKQSPEFDEFEVIQSIKQFERQRLECA